MNGEVVVENESKRRRDVNEEIKKLIVKYKVEEIINAEKVDA